MLCRGCGEDECCHMAAGVMNAVTWLLGCVGCCHVAAGL